MTTILIGGIACAFALIAYACVAVSGERDREEGSGGEDDQGAIHSDTVCRITETK